MGYRFEILYKIKYPIFWRKIPHNYFLINKKFNKWDREAEKLQACIRAMLLDLAVKSLYGSRLNDFGLRNPVHLCFPDNRDKYFSPYAGSLE